MPEKGLQPEDHALFSEFLTGAELASVKLYSYYPLLEYSKEQEQFYRLLPSDHSVAYPLTVRVSPPEVVSGELNFFTEVIFRNYRQGNTIPNDKFSLPSGAVKHDACIVINCVDNCFGHTFLKLYNIYTAYRQFAEKYDLVVLVPKSVSHFLPYDKGLRIVEFRLGYAEAMNCYDFDPVLKTLRAEYRTVDFLSMDTYHRMSSQREDIIRFFNFFGDGKLKTAERNICFYYRQDYFRQWNGGKQAKNITNLFEIMRDFFDPSVQFNVLGENDGSTFPDWIRDLRIDGYSKETDYLYHSIFRGSIISIGVMGSAMTQSSLFAPCSVYIVPEHKVFVIAQDLPNYQLANIPSHFENIYITGNATLSDITPSKLANQILMYYYTSMASSYKNQTAEMLSLKTNLISQKEFIEQKFPFVNYKSLSDLKQSISAKAEKSMLPGFYMNKVRKKLGSKKK